MKFIYDEQKAIQEKQRIDEETPELNRKAKADNRLLAYICAVGAVVLLNGLGYWLRPYAIETRRLLGGVGVGITLGVNCALMAGALGLALLAYRGRKKPVLTSEERYPSNVQYYVATKNKTILDVSPLRIGKEGGVVVAYCVTLALEDENHIVSKNLIEFSSFRTQERTDLDETIVDLDAKIIHIPYDP